MLDDDVPGEAKRPPETRQHGLLEGQAGCVVLGIPIAVAMAAVPIFTEGISSSAAWPAAVAICALSAMGLGSVYFVMHAIGRHEPRG